MGRGLKLPLSAHLRTGFSSASLELLGGARGPELYLKNKYSRTEEEMGAAILGFTNLWFSAPVQRSVPVGERSAGRVFTNLVSAWIYQGCKRS